MGTGKSNKNIIMYMHAGSGNHGCEAIVTALRDLIDEDKKLVIVSNNIEEDKQYSLNKSVENGNCELLQEKHIDKDFFAHVFYYGWRKISGDKESFLRYRFRNLLKYVKRHKDSRLAVSIGGDNYCYPDMVEDIILTDSMLHKKGVKTILLGCSIEPESLKSERLLEDLRSHEMIIARESISYKALLAAGFSKDKVKLCPDPAFTLETADIELPEGFADGNTVGLNVSPMVLGKEAKEGATINGYKKLIQHIMDCTNMQIALIPHVVWNSNDDRAPLRELYEEFKNTGRVIMIEDTDCKKLKGYISRCRIFVGARTHSTIAAYSSCVPTLVIGYSVKSRGIATDIFGTDERFVLPVQTISKPQQLVDSFDYMLLHEHSVKEHLKLVMPEYIETARKNAAGL